jgi:hypothetical protein
MKIAEKLSYNQKYELESYIVHLRYDPVSEIEFPSIQNQKSYFKYSNQYFSLTDIAKEFNILSVHILKDLLCIYHDTTKSHIEEKLIEYNMGLFKEKRVNGKDVVTFLINSKGTNMIKNMIYKIDNLRKNNPIDLTNKLYKIIESNILDQGLTENNIIENEKTDDYFLDENKDLNNLIIFGESVKILENLLPLQYMKELKFRGLLYRFIKELQYQKITITEIKLIKNESINIIDFTIKIFDWYILGRSFSKWHKDLFLETPNYFANYSSTSKYWKNKFKNYVNSYIPCEKIYTSFDDNIFSFIEEKFELYKENYPYKSILTVGENTLNGMKIHNYTIIEINEIIQKQNHLYEHQLLKLELIRREIFKK